MKWLEKINEKKWKQLITKIDGMSDQQLMKMGKDMLREKGIDDFELQGIRYGEKVRMFKKGELTEGEYDILSDDDTMIHLLGVSDSYRHKNPLFVKKKDENE